jgi:hypothetical protein
MSKHIYTEIVNTVTSSTPSTLSIPSTFNTIIQHHHSTASFNIIDINNSNTSYTSVASQPPSHIWPPCPDHDN